VKKHKTKIRLNWLLPVLVLAAITGFSNPTRVVFALQQDQQASVPSYNKVDKSQNAQNSQDSIEGTLNLSSSQITAPTESSVESSVSDNCYTYQNGGYSIQLQHVVLGNNEQVALSPTHNINTVSAVSLFGSCNSNKTSGKNGITTIVIGSVTSQRSLALSRVSKPSFIIAFSTSSENKITQNYLTGDDQESLPIISSNYKYSHYRFVEEGTLAVIANDQNKNILKSFGGNFAANISAGLILRC
jgi:hypothetical protein